MVLQAQSMAQLNCPSCHHHGLVWDWNQSHMNTGFATPWNGLPTNTWHGSAMLPPYHGENSSDEFFRRNSLRAQPQSRRSRRDLNSEDDESDFHPRRNTSPLSSRRGPVSDDSDDDVRSHRSGRRSRRRNSPVARNVSPAMSRRGSARKSSVVEDIIARRAKRNEEERAKQDSDTISNRGGRRYNDETMLNRGGKRYDDETNSNRGGRRYDDETTSNRGGRRNDDETSSNRGGRRNDFDGEKGNKRRDFGERQQDFDDTLSNRGSRRLSDDITSERGGHQAKSEDFINRNNRRLSDAKIRRQESTVLSTKSSPVMPRRYPRDLSSDDSDNELSDHRQFSTVSRKGPKTIESVELTGEDGEKNKTEVVNVSEETEKPPPPIPTEAWECEHCTFVNQAGTRVCVVCCKTTTQNKSTLKSKEGTNNQDNKKHLLSKKNMKSNLNKQSDYSDIDLAERMQKQLNISSPESEKKKGRRRRTISFWIGTKLYS